MKRFVSSSERRLISLTPGALFVYHFDLWLFRADALLDRLETALKKGMRLMLRGPEARAMTKEVEQDVAQLKSVISGYRDALAHGEGGGVDGITQHWPGFLALPGPGVAMAGFTATIIDGVRSSIDFDTRTRWLEQVRHSTVMIFAGTDALCGRVADSIDTHDAAGANT